MCSEIVFKHFTFFGLKNVIINYFGKKIFLGAFFIKLKCRCFQTGPGDFKNTKHLKFDRRQIFYASLKTAKKSHFLEF